MVSNSPKILGFFSRLSSTTTSYSHLALTNLNKIQKVKSLVLVIHRLNPDLRLDHDMLRFSARSPVEASSAHQAAIQLNNRPSAGSNNQGGVDQEMDDEGSEELNLEMNFELL
nr:uncharacterized protein LOC104118595 isoform X4 [Nicotiana tomentosiformis]